MKRFGIEVQSPAAEPAAFAEALTRSESGANVTPRLAVGSLRELFAAITETHGAMARWASNVAGRSA